MLEVYDAVKAFRTVAYLKCNKVCSVYVLVYSG